MASAAAPKFNTRNPAVKRIMQEIKEMQAEQCADFIADALEDDIFEWHFVIRGPPDTEFEGGIYHGRILLPAEYPFKPPSFMMLTPNGRFQTGVKICLSISSHHPEHWQPSWSVRTALTALIAFMPTPGQGALGSIDYTTEERTQLAAKSLTDVPKFGSPARQKVVHDMHARMLELQRAAAAAGSSSSGGAKQGSPAAAAAASAATAVAAAGSAAAPADPDADAVPSGRDSAASDQRSSTPLSSKQALPPGSPDTAGSDTSSSDQQQRQAPQLPASSGAASPQPLAAPVSAPTAHVQMHAAPALLQQQQRLLAATQGSLPGDMAGDRGLTFLVVVLSVAIVAMLFRKVMTAMSGYRLMV